MKTRIGVVAAVSAIFIAGIVAGCASSGNESIADMSMQSASAQIVKGRTSQAQVRQIYGDPIKSTFTDSGNESWEYEFTRLQSKPTSFIPYVNLIHSGAEGDKKSLVIFFDRNKIVQQFTVSTSKIDISRGLITR